MPRPDDASRLWDAIRAVSSTRTVPLARLYEAYTLAFPDRIGHGTVDTTIADSLQTLEGQGLLRRSLRTDSRANPPLPTRITRLDLPEPIPPTDPTDWYAINWHPSLRWIPTVFSSGRPGPTSRATLTAVNTWLKADPDLRPIAATERALEVFGDEKAIDRRVGGHTIWAPGRLDETLLAYDVEPLPMVTNTTGHGSRVLVIENKATYHSAVRAVAGRPCRYRAIGFGDGNRFRSMLPSIPQLHPGVTEVDYFGDLDSAGLDMPATAVTVGSEAGIDVRPAVDLYLWLVDLGRSRPHDWATDNTHIAWLDHDGLINAVNALVSHGVSLPQEGLTRTALHDDTTWAT